MGYKFYSDIKDEMETNQQLDSIRSFFSFDDTINGVINIDTEDYNTKGIVIEGKPHGLIIITFKANKNKLHAFFSYGLPQGEWVLYDKFNKKIKSKRIRKELSCFE